MGFWSSIGSAISSCVSGICSFASKVGGSLGDLCKEITVSIKLVVDLVSNIVDYIAKALGIVEEEDKPEEIGMRAEIAEAEGIKPENFDSYKEYIDHLKKNITIDSAKIENLSAEEKAKYVAIGTAVEMEAISEKYELEIPLGFYTGLAKAGFDGKQVKEFLETFKDVGKVTDIEKYSEGNLNRNDMIKTDIALEKAFQKIDSSLSLEAIDKKIDSIVEKNQNFDDKI